MDMITVDDWSKAPEWATQCGFIGRYSNAVWFSDEEYAYVNGQQGGRSFSFGSHCSFKKSDISGVTNRPSSPWNSQGFLPPVGVVCEARWRHDSAPEWHKFKLEFVGKRHSFATVGDEELHFLTESLTSGAITFRPIRSPDEIANDERNAVILDMHKIYMEGTLRSGGVYALYEAGYRKQEK